MLTPNKKYFIKRSLASVSYFDVYCLDMREVYKVIKKFGKQNNTCFSSVKLLKKHGHIAIEISPLFDDQTGLVISELEKFLNSLYAVPDVWVNGLDEVNLMENEK